MVQSLGLQIHHLDCFGWMGLGWEACWVGLAQSPAISCQAGWMAAWCVLAAGCASQIAFAGQAVLAALAAG